MVNKFDSLPQAVIVLELARLHISQGHTIKGMTKEEVENWTVKQCPFCKVWHDSVTSEFCSSECENNITETFHELGD